MILKGKKQKHITMKTIRLFTLLSLLSMVACTDSKQSNEEVGGIFTTSQCFDLLCTPQYIETIKAQPQFALLFSDSVFVSNIAVVNSNCSASKLCNLYAELKGDRNSITQCLYIVQHLDSLAANIEWASNIVEVKPQLSYTMQKLVDCGYSDYWENKVYPLLKSHIDMYNVNADLLDSIHNELKVFFYPNSDFNCHSNIYILNIENAFNLSDESFCCTPLILDPEIEKQLRLNFMNIYIHENLHNVYLSPELMEKLNQLDQDPFYNAHETIARSHGEGLNEAFVVAAEVYISQKLGIRSNESVYEEFAEYVDGSLVLSPIIYVNLSDKKNNESYNDFLLRLFESGILSVGNIESNYLNAMNEIHSQISN